MGLREGRNDSRAHVFWHTIDLVGGMAARTGDDALQCFILENVEGILKQDAHGQKGIDEVRTRLLEVVPDFFVTTICANSRDYSLAQNRPRVYVVGVRRDLLNQGRTISKPRPHVHHPKLLFTRWLAPHAPSSCCEVPARLVEKKRKWDAALQKLDEQRAPGFGWSVACSVIERDCDKTFAQLRTCGTIGTVTTSSCLWFMWSREKLGSVSSSELLQPGSTLQQVPSIAESHQRYIMPIEHLALQGFPMQDAVLHAALSGLSDNDVLVGAGNAMSVPVVGAIIGAVLARSAVGHRRSRPLAVEVPRAPSALAALAVESSDEEPEVESQEVQIQEAASGSGRVSQVSCNCWLHLHRLPAGPVHHISRDAVKLGRDPGLVPPEGLLAGSREVDYVSRVHAQLSRQANAAAEMAVLVTDLGSSHGTVAKIARLGNTWRKVSSSGCILENGDQVGFGTLGEPPADFPLLYRVELLGGFGRRGRAICGGA